MGWGGKQERAIDNEQVSPGNAAKAGHCWQRAVSGISPKLKKCSQMYTAENI